MDTANKATVVKHTGSHYLLSKLPQWELFPAVIKGKLRLKGFNSTNPIAVGDVVEYEGGLHNKEINKFVPTVTYHSQQPGYGVPHCNG